jgi:hypothetical protein
VIDFSEAGKVRDGVEDGEHPDLGAAKEDHGVGEGAGKDGDQKEDELGEQAGQQGGVQKRAGIKGAGIKGAGIKGAGLRGAGLKEEGLKEEGLKEEGQTGQDSADKMQVDSPRTLENPTAGFTCPPECPPWFDALVEETAQTIDTLQLLGTKERADVVRFRPFRMSDVYAMMDPNGPYSRDYDVWYDKTMHAAMV